MKGPLDIATLRTHWERGELGPDSLCWRKGFDGWQPVCRVKGLTELLVPRATVAPSKPEELVPDPRADTPDFPLKGAEALRILVEAAEIPPPLPVRSPLPAPPVLEPEPVTAPALEPEPDTVPDAPRAQEAAAPPEAASEPRPTQGEARARGGMWLALGGGLVGGILVTCIVGLLGLSAGLGSQARVALPEPTPPASSTEPVFKAPAPVEPSVAALPVPVAPKPDVPAPLPTRPMLSGSPTVEPPKRVAVPARPAPSEPSPRRQTKTGAQLATAAVAKERVTSRPTEAAEVDDDSSSTRSSRASSRALDIRLRSRSPRSGFLPR